MNLCFNEFLIFFSIFHRKRRSLVDFFYYLFVLFIYYFFSTVRYSSTAHTIDLLSERNRVHEKRKIIYNIERNIITSAHTICFLRQKDFCFACRSFGLDNEYLLHIMRNRIVGTYSARTHLHK